jgi:hypothetical protein
VIPPEQLAAALERLDPRDLEVLDLSLRRHVPDETMARVYGWKTPEVARRRATAIEHLADDLGVERGEDLGAVLQALLEPATWTVLDGARESGSEPGPAEETAAASEAGPATAVGAAAAGTSADGAEPVLEMLTEPAPPPARSRRLRPGRLALAGVGGLGLLAAAGLVGAAILGDEDSSTQRPRGGEETRPFVPQLGGQLAAPFPSAPGDATTYPTAYLRRSTVLYRRPGGRPLIRIAARTEWRTPRVLGVVRQRGGWVAVQAPELRNGKVGWIPEDRARLGSVDWALYVNTSRRRLVVQRARRTVKRYRIAVGSPRHPTPTGRFSVTDKLRVTDKGSPYGCCVLALSGHQTRLPRDWSGGDRLALHATADISSIGRAVSLGCMRLTPRQARWLIQKVPLGAPIFIRR